MFTGTRLLKIVFFVLLSFNFFALSFFALNGELDFHSDIARDFLLLHEIEEKKIVLIGGSTSAAGVFHGPTWLYLNFPAYAISNGNPVAVEWFLIFLVAVFTYVNFTIAKNLFGKKTAYLFVIFVTSFLIPWGKAFNHPQAALLLAPSFFYTFVKYINTYKIRFLCLHLLISGVLIQFEIAFGAPIFVLSSVFIISKLFTKKKLKHAWAFLLILIPLSTYLIFDIRHDFFQLKNLIKYIVESQSARVAFGQILKNRLDYMAGVGSLAPQFKVVNVASTLLFLLLVYKCISENKNRRIYSIFLYLYLGYFLLTLLSSRTLLAHQFVPLVPLAMMTFLSLVETRFARIVTPIIIAALVLNIASTTKYLQSSNRDIDSRESSWKQISNLSNEVFQNQDDEFGYFIYSPDKLSYVPKYAMIYSAKNHREKKAHYFQKKTITYVISAPAPLNDPYAKYFTNDYWIANSIKITKEPANETTFPNGYTVRRYELTEEEITIPFDKHEDSGIHFR